jgi:hypothetical protein
LEINSITSPLGIAGIGGEDISPQRFPDNPIIFSGKYLGEESGFAEQGFYNADVWDVIDGLKAFISGA